MARRRVAAVGAPLILIVFFVAAGAPTPLTSLYESQLGIAPWIVTVAFGLYSIALLLSLLIVGGLSDYTGRRPVLIGSVMVELASMIVLLTTDSVGGLLVGRILQGIATAAASSAFSAATVELLPEHRKRLGGVITSVVPTTGLGVGALFGGLVAGLSPNGLAIVWTTLLIVFVAGAVMSVLTPETAAHRQGALRSLIPRATVPLQVRRLFANTVPSLVSGMMAIALFLALAPVVFRTVLAVTSPVLIGLAALLAFAVASTTSIAGSRFHPRRLRFTGSGVQVLAAAVFLASVALGATWLIWVAAILEGFGLGATFSGATRGLIPEVGLHERAGLFTAIWLVVYLTLGLSAIASGLLATSVGPIATAVAFGLVQAVFAVTGVLVGLHAERRPTGATMPSSS